MKKLSLAAALSAALIMGTFTAQPARADGGVILGVILVSAAVVWLSKKSASAGPGCEAETGEEEVRSLRQSSETGAVPSARRLFAFADRAGP